MTPRLGVVVPVNDGAEHLAGLLSALRRETVRSDTNCDTMMELPSASLKLLVGVGESNAPNAT